MRWWSRKLFDLLNSGEFVADSGGLLFLSRHRLNLRFARNLSAFLLATASVLPVPQISFFLDIRLVVGMGSCHHMCWGGVVG